MKPPTADQLWAAIQAARAKDPESSYFILARLTGCMAGWEMFAPETAERVAEAIAGAQSVKEQLGGAR